MSRSTPRPAGWGLSFLVAFALAAGAQPREVLGQTPAASEKAPPAPTAVPTPAAPAAAPTGAAAPAGAPTIQELSKRVTQALHPPRTSSRDLEISVTGADRRTATWQGRQLRKPGEGGGKVLTLLEAPPSVAGFAILVSRSSSEADARWMYVPPVRRVRRLEYPGRFEYFLGTDLSATDFGFLDFDPSARVVRKEQQDGRDAWLLQEEPKPAVPGGYSRILTWVTTEDAIPVRRDFYDQAGKLWKTETRSDVSKVDGVPTPMLLSVRNVQEGGSTTLRYRDVRYDVALEEEGFTPETLASVGESLSVDAAPAAAP